MTRNISELLGLMRFMIGIDDSWYKAYLLDQEALEHLFGSDVMPAIRKCRGRDADGFELVEFHGNSTFSDFFWNSIL